MWLVCRAKPTFRTSLDRCHVTSLILRTWQGNHLDWVMRSLSHMQDNLEGRASVISGINFALWTICTHIRSGRANRDSIQINFGCSVLVDMALDIRKRTRRKQRNRAKKGTTYILCMYILRCMCMCPVGASFIFICAYYDVHTPLTSHPHTLTSPLLTPHTPTHLTYPHNH